MTFTPTPHSDLPTPEQYYDHEVAQAQVEASILADQQTFNASVLASIADLYARIPAGGAGTQRGVWHWADSILTAGSGSLHIDILGDTNRRVHVSKVDADGLTLQVAGLGVGDPLVLMDDPDTPPVTAFRQYVISSALVGVGSWWQFDATRVAIFGSQDTPTEGTRISLLFG
jgi:hypothetical protein